MDEKNKSLHGGYELKITSHDSKVTLIASGSEVELALDVQDELKNLGIESKVVSMPCQELFDAQPEDYKEKILERNNLMVSLEAGNSLSWSKYVKDNDISVGINSFGQSAPYKDLFENFNLTSNKIVSQIQRKIRK